MKRVVIISRKLLKVNTRIFKQAHSLTKAGYHVKAIGIWSEGLKEKEIKDGYAIWRVKLGSASFKNIMAPLTNDAFLPAVFSIYKDRRIREVCIDTYNSIRDNFRKEVLVKNAKSSKSLRFYWVKVIYNSLRILKMLSLSLGYLCFRFLLYIYRLFRRLLFCVYKPFHKFFLAFEYWYKVYKICAREKIDIIHANDLDALPVALLVAKQHRAKLVYDAQELYTEIHTLTKFDKVILTLQEYIFSRKADKIIAVNEFVAKEMEKRYRINIDEVIINCPPYEEIDITRRNCSDIRDIFKIPFSIPLLVYSGGLNKKRGIENTILALKYLSKKAHMVLLGDGPIKKDLEKLAKRENLRNRVYFYNYVRHEKVPSFIATATVGIVPYESAGLNHYYASPSKLFHYIMAGLPVAASNFPFLRKIVLGNDIGAVFDASSPQDIARAVDRILYDEVGYNRFRKNTLEAKKRYCWENEEKRFLKLYEELANKA